MKGLDDLERGVVLFYRIFLGIGTIGIIVWVSAMIVAVGDPLYRLLFGVGLLVFLIWVVGQYLSLAARQRRLDSAAARIAAGPDPQGIYEQVSYATDTTGNISRSADKSTSGISMVATIAAACALVLVALYIALKIITWPSPN